MNVAQLQRLCARYPAAERVEHGEPSNVLVYSVGGKTFAYFKTSPPEQWRFSLRTPRDRFLELTDVPGIKPARYLGRFHWITVVDVRSVPPGELREWLAWSYHKALSSLSQRKRLALTGPA